jgi:hypothetical protein
MSPREKADRARQILADAVFAEAMQDIRGRIVAKLESIAVTDHAAQHELVLTLQLLQRIPARFQAYIDDLLLEQHNAKQAEFVKKTRQKLPRA